MEMYTRQGERLIHLMTGGRVFCVGRGWGRGRLLTVLVHGMRLGLLLADVGEGAHDGDAVGQLLVVLVVVLLQQGFTDPLPGVLADGARHLMLIQNHIWGRGDKHAKQIDFQFFRCSSRQHCFASVPATDAAEADYLERN